MIGVLALQGASSGHLAAFARLGAAARAVRTPGELAGVDSLVIPGGESTTMWMLAESSGCFDAIAARLDAGMPAFGTCAGMIMLAAEVLDGRPDQRSLAAIDVDVRRNAFGRQVASFEADLMLAEPAGTTAEPFRAVFIRAPWVERVGSGVEVLATVRRPPARPETGPAAAGPAGEAPAGEAPTGEPGTPADVAVLCRAGRVLVSSFHPELTDDLRIHRMFLEMVAAA